jgi:hypothetical protein
MASIMGGSAERLFECGSVIDQSPNEPDKPGIETGRKNGIGGQLALFYQYWLPLCLVGDASLLKVPQYNGLLLPLNGLRDKAGLACPV